MLKLAKCARLVILVALSLVSCQFFPTSEASFNNDGQRNQTADAQLTQSAYLIETLSSETADKATAQQIEATKAQSVIFTQQAQATAARIPSRMLFFPFVVISAPTATSTFAFPTLTSTSPPQAATPLPTIPAPACDQAELLDEQPDGPLFAYVGQIVRKTWEIRNVGTCTWTPEYQLVVIFEESLAAQMVQVSEYVRPGQSNELSVTLVAPLQPGSYQAFASLRNAAGELFDFGPQGQASQVIQLEAVPYSGGIVFDFARDYCAATWRSGAGVLPCVQVENNENGLVGLLDYPVLESGLKFGPSLWMVPNQRPNGWISGEYPYLAIQPGDRLLAELGCLSDNPLCDVLFQIRYEIPGGSSGMLGEWRETYDGLTTPVNINLYSLAGNLVRFTLTARVLNNQPQDDEAVWVYVRIER